MKVVDLPDALVVQLVLHADVFHPERTNWPAAYAAVRASNRRLQVVMTAAENAYWQPLTAAVFPRVHRTMIKLNLIGPSTSISFHDVFRRKFIQARVPSLFREHSAVCAKDITWYVPKASLSDYVFTVEMEDDDRCSVAELVCCLERTDEPERQLVLRHAIDFMQLWQNARHVVALKVCVNKVICGSLSTLVLFAGGLDSGGNKRNGLPLPTSDVGFVQNEHFDNYLEMLELGCYPSLSDSAIDGIFMIGDRHMTELETLLYLEVLAPWSNES